MWRIFIYPWEQTFFGLAPELREAAQLEPFFNLAYYFGMSWETYYQFPISYRRWIMKRLNDEVKRSSEAGEQPMPSKGAQHNDPHTRSLMGKARPSVPHSLKRF